MGYFVYMLMCSDETLYTGITIDVKKRLAVHNLGKGAKYTKSRIPAKLVYVEACEDKSAALSREIQIKRMKRVEKLALIESNVDIIKNF